MSAKLHGKPAALLCAVLGWASPCSFPRSERQARESADKMESGEERETRYVSGELMGHHSLERWGGRDKGQFGIFIFSIFH
jgi:hypothetical protein